MAQYTTKTCPVREWTQLTDADVTAISFQVGIMPQGGRVFVKCTTNTTAPTTTAGASWYREQGGERAIPLSDLALGLSGAVRVWAYPDSYAVEMMVNHA